MGSESGIRLLLFIHLSVIALVARQATAGVQAKELTIALVRHAIVFWLISVLAIVVSMAVAAVVFAAIYTQRATYPSTALIWVVEFGVAGVLVLASAFALNRRLKKHISEAEGSFPEEQA